jgi:glycosyltransferase involved in cell wall biosynthesis
MKMISVIIPCHNQGRFLKEAVASIQEDVEIQIIIINDGSTDDTRDFCTDLEVLDSRVMVLHLDKTQGKPTAVNTGIKMSSGKLITILDADDMREAHSLQRMSGVLEANERSFVYDDIILYADGRKGNVWKFPEYDFMRQLKENTVHTGIMFTREAWEDTGGYPEEFKDGREDWAFNILLGSHGYCGIHIPFAGYIYRRGDQNRTLRNNTPEWKNHFASQIRNRFADLYAGRFPMGCCGGRNPYAGANSNITPEVELLVGSEGMTAVEYLGGNFGTQSFYGGATGTGYRFDAGANKTKMVDNRDLHTEKGTGLLDYREHTRTLFKIADTQPEAPIVLLEPPTVEETTVEKVAGIPLSSKINASGKNYAKLMDAGYTTVESVLGATTEAISAITGIPVEVIEKLKAKIS